MGQPNAVLTEPVAAVTPAADLPRPRPTATFLAPGPERHVRINRAWVAGVEGERPYLVYDGPPADGHPARPCDEVEFHGAVRLVTGTDGESGCGGRRLRSCHIVTDGGLLVR